MYFPVNYAESRKRFKNYFKDLPKRTRQISWKIPSKVDQDLTVDGFYIPAEKTTEKLLVLTSGVHGPETFAGAAIQFLFLEEILQTIKNDNFGILLIHAMNPFGFKYQHRCTENHINLNRNFCTTGKNFTSKSDLAIRLNQQFLAKEPVSSLQSEMLKKLNFREGKPFFDDCSLDAFVKATVPGQFESPEFIEYGGRQMEPQSELFAELMNDLLPHYQTVLGLDLHTGLGEQSRLHLLTGGPQERNDATLVDRLFDPEGDKLFYEFTPPHKEGFYEVRGSLNSVFSELSKTDQSIASLTMEFGTFGHSMEAQLDGLNLFLLEHQGRFYGFSNQAIEAEVRAKNFERSYLQTDEWRDSVLMASRGLLKRVLGRYLS